ncbi:MULTISPECIES: hypothetical protein [Saccharothrix]|uniref:hypothetical protein n=1 Tax=Saccharothrix TaxID=2071 RepID=UPI00093E0100|nr:hypothetical protein [Saccharothrix sp. CB00851]OKI18669.1 hypothetical protein A6A25_39665 [Saccharothrix sp. CB00851]
MVTVLAPDVRWTEAAGSAYAGTYTGPAAVVEGVFRRMDGEWSSFTVEVDELLDAGHALAAART